MNYAKKANKARIKVLEMIYKAQTSHIGSNFSCIDILTVLFDKIDIEKDELVVSKGWVAASVYYFLADKGVIPKEDLERFCGADEEEYIGLIEPHGKFGLRFAGGSMGYGLPAAVGFALSKKLKGEDGTVYCLMSDGELAIGTTWEAALLAAHHNLDNIVVIVDNNGLQAMGERWDILKSHFPNVCVVRLVDGHNFTELNEEFEDALALRSGEPRVLFCNTIKGKGVSFMENNNDWHYLHVEEDDYKKALTELNGNNN